MRPSVPTLAFAIALAAGPASGRAGYVGLGYELGGTPRGDVDKHFDGADPGARLMLGHRLELLAVEASVSGSRLTGASRLTESKDAGFYWLSAGLNLKLVLPVASPLEAYGKAGLHRTWIVNAPGNDSDLSYAGFGHLLGGGLQMGLNPGALFEVGVWFEYSHQTASLESAGDPHLDSAIDTVLLGLSFGSGL